MQRVGVVVAVREEACGAEALDQLAVPVNTDMPAGDVVVLSRKCPVDRFRVTAGHRHRDHTSGPQHSGQFGHDASVARHVFEHLGCDDPVEAAVGERERGPVGGHEVAVAPRFGCLFVLLQHGPHPRCRPGQRLAVRIEGDGHCAKPHGFETVPPAPTPEVEHPLAWTKPKPVVPDGQHENGLSGLMDAASAFCARKDGADAIRRPEVGPSRFPDVSTGPRPRYCSMTPRY